MKVPALALNLGPVMTARLRVAPESPPTPSKISLNADLRGYWVLSGDVEVVTELAQLLGQVFGAVDEELWFGRGALRSLRWRRRSPLHERSP